VRLGSDLEYFKTNYGDNLLGKNQLIKAEKPLFKSKYGPISLTYGVRHIVNCLRGKEKPISSGKHALKALELIEAGIISANNKNKRIYLG